MITTTELTGRHRALLRAVEAGRCELSSSSREPDLLVDGLCFSDQFAARQLVRAQLVAAHADSGGGVRVAASLTDAGRQALATAA